MIDDHLQSQHALFTLVSCCKLPRTSIQFNSIHFIDKLKEQFYNSQQLQKRKEKGTTCTQIHTIYKDLITQNHIRSISKDTTRSILVIYLRDQKLKNTSWKLSTIPSLKSPPNFCEQWRD